MDIFDEYIVQFWSCLSREGVRYIMVGGFATNLNGFSRHTDDMDIWLEDTPGNRRKLRAAFRNCDMGDFEPLERMTFLPGWTDFTLNNGLRLDIMTSMKGLENYTFDECLEVAQIAEIEGVQVPFLHINHLLANKKAVNRPKDQLDVIELERIKKLLDEEGGPPA
jgi:hypothetical protein